jgi:TRAP-type C4-dicarboxylate transport system permease small subunit
MSAPVHDVAEPGHHGFPTRAPAGRLGRIAELVSGVMFALVFVIFNYKIATRYFGHDEAVWADEISVILFIWIIFWANAFLVRDKEQITFDLAYRPLSERWKRVFAILRLLLIGGIFLWALPGSLDYILFLWRERTPVLNLRLDFIYSCFGLFMIAVVLRAVWGLYRLLSAKWRAYI